MQVIQKNKSEEKVKAFCGRDGGFTEKSIIERLPAILKETREHLDASIYESPEQFKEMISKINVLHSELFDHKAMFPAKTMLQKSYKNQNEKDLDDWIQWEKKFIDTPWIDMPWFYLENYVYKLLNQIVMYYDEPTKRDPFTSQKQKSLEQAIENQSINIIISLASDAIEKDHNKLDISKRLSLLQEVILGNLWSNQADLSFFRVGTKNEKKSNHDAQEHLIINQLDQVVCKLSGMKDANIAFINDNSGLEIVSDLALADLLISLGVAKSITMYLKAQPVFVSDTMVKDVHYTLDVLESMQNEKVASFCKRMRQYITQSYNKGISHHSCHVDLKDDYFFTSPCPMWEAPQKLIQEFSNHDLIFVKGDANYRRFTGDLHWDPRITNMKDVCDSYWPKQTSLVFMRTLKSEVLVGLSGSAQWLEKAKKLDSEEPSWRFNGKYGVLQFVDLCSPIPNKQHHGNYQQ